MGKDSTSTYIWEVKYTNKIIFSQMEKFFALSCGESIQKGEPIANYFYSNYYPVQPRHVPFVKEKHKICQKKKKRALDVRVVCVCSEKETKLIVPISKLQYPHHLLVQTKF